MTPPVILPAVAAPVRPEALRTVDMTGNNAWANAAYVWLDAQGASRVFANAVKDIKNMIEPDVGVASGHGINVRRTKAGALVIKEGPP